MKTKETLEETIKRLPKSADKIAEFFKSQGVKGHRAESSKCPLARWLKRQGHRGAYVTGRTLKFSDKKHDKWEWYCGSNQVALLTFLPAAASAFAKRFDAGKYPDLVVGTRKKRVEASS